MRNFYFNAVGLALLYCAQTVLAANSFAGANVCPMCSNLLGEILTLSGTQNYFIYSLPDADRHAILDGMKSAGMKVRRCSRMRRSVYHQ